MTASICNLFFTSSYIHLTSVCVTELGTTLISSPVVAICVTNMQWPDCQLGVAVLCVLWVVIHDMTVNKMLLKITTAVLQVFNHTVTHNTLQ